MKPRVTVSLTRYREPDALLAEVLRAACWQQGVEGEVLLIEQDPAGAFDEADFAAAPLPLRILRTKVDGLSAARNLALDEARYPHLLYLDADAVPRPDWAARLAGALDNKRFAVVGSRILPRWPTCEPRWARATAIKDQYSMLDLGAETRPFPRVVGAAFGVARERVPATLRFDPALGRRGGKLFGGEESDFCRQARDAGCGIGYVGAAVVDHVVPPDRVRLGWMMRRIFYAGHGRGRLGGRPAPSGASGNRDWLVMALFGPAYLLGWLRAKLGG
jgi:glycosyltransferase involved in cell wall biosynthesis